VKSGQSFQEEPIEPFCALERPYSGEPVLGRRLAGTDRNIPGLCVSRAEQTMRWPWRTSR